MTLSDLERRDAKSLSNVLSFDLERPIRQNNTCGAGEYFWGSAKPRCKGRVSSAPNFGGSLLFMRTPFDAERPN